MIDKSKTYRTRDGREVRIYATDGDTPYCIHGAVLNEDGWTAEGWRSNGKWDRTDNESTYDLIEVRPRIQREVWVNVYPSWLGPDMTYHSKQAADEGYSTDRIACVKLTIDCEEGEGL